MKKIIYICNNNQLLVYQCTFNKQKILFKINQLLEKDLEGYYYPENHVAINQKNTCIQSSIDLITHLKKILLENKEIDLSEIRNLIESDNSCMRTPQTIMAISHIFDDFNYALLNYFSLENYNNIINMAYRHQMSQENLSQKKIIVAFNNQYVMENLGIYLNHLDTTIYSKTKILY